LGYIVAGWRSSKGAGQGDAWVFKLDKNGNKEWDKTFGESEYDGANSIQQTNDGGYIVAGHTASKGAGQGDAWVIKLDKNGNKEWDRAFGGSLDDSARSIQQTSDFGYIVAGETRSKEIRSKSSGFADVWVFKLDKNGNKEWDRAFGGSKYNGASSIQQTTDLGYIVAGYTESKGAGKRDVWIIKLDKNGNKEWDKTFGGSKYDEAKSIQQTSDGGYIVAGYTELKGAGQDDAWLIKLDKNGNKEWDKTFGGSEKDGFSSVSQTHDGGYVAAGHTYSKGAGEGDGWILKLDKEGNLNCK
jgi:hypothetical protein